MKTFPTVNKTAKSLGRIIAAIFVIFGALAPIVYAAPPDAPPPPESAAAQSETAPAASTDASGQPPEPPATTTSPEESNPADLVRLSLTQEVFSYPSKNMVDPFTSFMAPAGAAPQEEMDSEEEDPEAPSEATRPLTPLQKMNIAEIERGLRAITWGALGRRAIIEDSSGKGYIVTVGTPAGGRNSSVSGIFKDHLVIQQQNWDRKAKRYIPQNTIVKLKKELEK